MRKILINTYVAGAIVVSVIVATCFIQEPPSHAADTFPTVIRPLEGPRYYKSEVVRVVDGDTVDLRFKVWTDITLDKRIRFDNLDVWETRGDNKDKGIDAKNFLINILEEGTVYLKTTGETGSFGRTLGSLYILRGDKMVDVSEEMKNNGHKKN
ncbi:MAG: hypothetical protein GF411_08510 [Candidatus Lokiarchaeota archaeon]|nr:hypothetical protein [Candidatus Lokiarchaeota archaeon]